METKRITRVAKWGAVALLGVVLAIKFLFIGYYRIPQNGMYPGLPAGSAVFTARRAYAGPAQVKRGDIVVFVREEEGLSYNYIWRVVGLPGDTIAAVGDALTINGQAVARERIREETGAVIFRERMGETGYEIAFEKSPNQLPPDASVKVPPDHFFVMGDNRLDARDSRSFGPIPFSSIIGRKL